MQTFNRFIVILLSMFLLVIGVLLVVMPVDATQSLLGYLQGFTPASYTITGVLMAIIAAFLLASEVMPRRSEGFTAHVGDGLVQYPHEAVAVAIDKELVLLDGVRQSKTNVWGSGQEVDAHIRLVLESNLPTPEVVSRAVAKAHSKVKEDFGLKLRRPRISIDRIEGGVPPVKEPVRTTTIGSSS